MSWGGYEVPSDCTISREGPVYRCEMIFANAEGVERWLTDL